MPDTPRQPSGDLPESSPSPNAPPPGDKPAKPAPQDRPSNDRGRPFGVL